MTGAGEGDRDRIGDELEIRQLPSRYAIAVDDRDLSRLGELYVSDAKFEGLSGEIVGRKEIIAYVGTALDRFDGVSVHTPHPGTVDFEGPDEASGMVPSHVEFSEKGQQFVLALRYHDRYARNGGRWRFSGRRIEVRYATPADAYPTALAGIARPGSPGLDRHTGTSREPSRSSGKCDR